MLMRESSAARCCSHAWGFEPSECGSKVPNNNPVNQMAEKELRDAPSAQLGRGLRALGLLCFLIDARGGARVGRYDKSPRADNSEHLVQRSRNSTRTTPGWQAAPAIAQVCRQPGFGHELEPTRGGDGLTPFQIVNWVHITMGQNRPRGLKNIMW
jgi:hypothetical protein